MFKITTHRQTTLSTDSLKTSFSKLIGRQDLGFLKLPFDQKALNSSIEMGKNIAQNFEHLVVVGIGGSSMGPRAITEISGSESRISFLDNVDSIETEGILNRLKDLNKTAWLFISKSGTTIEILWTAELVAQFYKKKSVALWTNTFYITENTDSSLNNLARQHNRPALEIPLNVGGRFSVLSPVGLVIAEYLGVSPSDLLAGAQTALQNEENVLNCVNQCLASFDRKEDITLFWFYSSRMRWFGYWVQQLWAESLGKKIALDGKPAPTFSTPMLSIGACDQHSIMQQVIEGPKNKFVHVFRFNTVEKSQFTITDTQFKETQLLEGLNFGDLIKAQAISTETAMRDSGVSTMLFEMPDLSSKSLGFLFMFYQLVVATIGEYTKINAFDQPGVALSKKLTLELIEKNKQP